MSTYVYLECQNHEPPLRASEESGQHLHDLPQIRRDIADRDVLVRLYAESDWLDLGDYFRNNTIRFLAEHPRCDLGIRDEYGEAHSTAEPQPAADEEMR